MSKNIKTKITQIALWFTPVILLFSNKIPFNFEERLKFFFLAFLKLTPIIFLVNMVTGWHDEQLYFLKSLYGILLVNSIIGVFTHIKLKTFDIGEFFKSTLITIVVIFAVYFTLEKLGNSIPEGFLEMSFISSVQLMTMLFPTSKIILNCFVLSNGTFPPMFLIQKIYSYEKDGNLKVFLEFLNNKKDEETTPTDSTD